MFLILQLFSLRKRQGGGLGCRFLLALFVIFVLYEARLCVLVERIIRHSCKENPTSSNDYFVFSLPRTFPDALLSFPTSSVSLLTLSVVARRSSSTSNRMTRTRCSSTWHTRLSTIPSASPPLVRIVETLRTFVETFCTDCGVFVMSPLV